MALATHPPHWPGGGRHQPSDMVQRGLTPPPHTPKKPKCCCIFSLGRRTKVPPPPPPSSVLRSRCWLSFPFTFKRLKRWGWNHPNIVRLQFLRLLFLKALGLHNTCHLTIMFTGLTWPDEVVLLIFWQCVCMYGLFFFFFLLVLLMWIRRLSGPA